MPKIWTKERETFPSVDKDMECTAAVIGGGLTGVMLAAELARRGLDVILLERGTIASGKTERSTAKATAAHPMVTTTLWEKITPETAKKYVAANLAGLEHIRKLRKDGIVSVEAAAERDMYIYALYGTRRLRKEYFHLGECGVECEFIEGDDCPFPFNVDAAIRVPRQMALDPVRFSLDLCKNGGMRVFEYSDARVEGKHVIKCGGHTIRAEYIAVCTNYPVGVPGAMAPIRLSRKTSHVAVFKMRGDEGIAMPDIMAFGVDGGYGYRYASDGGLIVSGETDRSALPGASERLVAAVKEFSPEAVLVESWTNNDTYTHDNIPYAGKLNSGVYIACGYSAWGMTNSAACALITAEQICGGGLWYDDIFSPRRNFLHGGMAPFSEHVSTALEGRMKQMSQPPEMYSGDVACGCAEIINFHGKRTGAYRDDDGTLYLVDLKCPHLGCSLQWNNCDKTWDCPCHGSRFTYTGECISNPSDRGVRIEG